MLQGLTTVSFFADDITAARDWYTKLLGIQPYFTREIQGTPAYVEFRIGDYQHELGIIDRRFAAHARQGNPGDPDDPGDPDAPGGAVIYWHVDDVQASFQRLLSMGATEHEQPVERGPGFVTASVVDPFGNLLGVMYNQHYLDVLASRPKA
jgi:catechol 2,3-dioxygenase-like lactoylglutathione lyase family enzyme